MHVKLRNDASGEIKELDLGWSWSLFFSPIKLGSPFREVGANDLAVLACLPAAVAVGTAKAVRLHSITPGWAVLAAALLIGFMCLLATNGNRVCAKRLLTNGWSFADEDRVVARAKMLWAIS